MLGITGATTRPKARANAPWLLPGPPSSVPSVQRSHCVRNWSRTSVHSSSVDESYCGTEGTKILNSDPAEGSFGCRLSSYLVSTVSGQRKSGVDVITHQTAVGPVTLHGIGHNSPVVAVSTAAHPDFVTAIEHLLKSVALDCGFARVTLLRPTRATGCGLHPHPDDGVARGAGYVEGQRTVGRLGHGRREDDP